MREHALEIEATYQAKCACGWKSPMRSGFAARRYAETDHAAHVEEHYAMLDRVAACGHTCTDLDSSERVREIHARFRCKGPLFSSDKVCPRCQRMYFDAPSDP